MECILTPPTAAALLSQGLAGKGGGQVIHQVILRPPHFERLSGIRASRTESHPVLRAEAPAGGNVNEGA